MKRKIYDDLLAWKKTSQGSSAILIEGAYRFAKTTDVYTHLQKKSHAKMIVKNEEGKWIFHK